MAIPSPDQIWADFDLDGSVHEPAKQDIRRYSRYIQTLAEAGAGAKGYSTKAAMDADTGQPDGTVGVIRADPVDSYNFPTLWTFSDAGNVWVQGVDRIGEMQADVDQAQGGVDDIKAGVPGLPARANFKAKTGYTQAWRTISNPATRWTITETDGSFKIDTTGAVPQAWPVGIKMPYDLVPGDTIEAEFKITSGTIGAEGGPFIGTDTATTGDISTAAIMYHWRNAGGGSGIYGQNYTGTGGIVSGYTTSPQAGDVGDPAVSVPIVTGDINKITVKVRNNRSLDIELSVNGVLKLKLSAPGVLPVGRVIVGYVVPVSASARLISVKRTGFNGTVVHIDTTAAAGGNGMIFAPVQTWDAAVAVALANRHSTLDVKILSPELRAAIVADDKIFPRYRIRGRGGSQTKIISADYTPTDWALLGGTTKVYYRASKNAAGNANVANTGAVYLTGVQMNPAAGWYNFPDTILPYRTVAPADLETETAGGRRVSGGNLYVRIPDAVGTVPNSTPMEVAISEATLYCIGAPQIDCENIVFSRGGIFNMYGDRATGVFRHCGFEWCETNGTEDAAGNFYYLDCWWDAAGNDLAARTLPAGYAETLSAPPVSVYINPKMRRSVGGDGIANHALSIALRAKMIVINPDIADIGKDGIVPASCDFQISGGRIARCAQAQIEVIGGASSVAGEEGMAARGSISDCVLDPAGVGLFGYLATGCDGGKLDVTIDRVHITTPTTAEIRGNRIVVGGRTQVVADFVTRYTNITTERDAGTRVIGGNSVVTMTKGASFAV